MEKTGKVNIVKYNDKLKGLFHSVFMSNFEPSNGGRVDRKLFDEGQPFLNQSIFNFLLLEKKNGF